VVKSGSFGSSQGPLTAVVTVPSGSDIPSPGSTSAGSNEPGASGPGHQQQPGGPVAEGKEAGAAVTRLADETAADDSASVAAAACSWEVEQAGSGPHAAAEDSAASKDSAAAAAGRASGGARSRRWVQSSGNIWLLQGLADVLGISRESAVADAVTPGDAAEGRRPRLSSAAGGLWSDEGVCGSMCGGKWGTSHVPKMAPLTASQRLTNEAIMQVRCERRGEAQEGTSTWG
jgi:hypothetical protein